MRIALPYCLVMILAAGVGSFSAVDNLYYRHIGLSLAAISLMIVCFNIAVSAAELPFAILFDKKSVKATLYIGFILRICAFALFALNFGFGALIMAQILAGIATAAGSGTTTALVLNTVREQTYESMSKEQSRLTFLSGWGSVLGASIGMIIFHYFPAGIWWLAVFFFALAILIVRQMPDIAAEGSSVPLKTLAGSWLNLFKLRNTYLLMLTNAAAIGPLFLWQFKFNYISSWFVILGFYVITLGGTAAAKFFHAYDLGRFDIRWSILLNIFAVLAFAFSQTAIMMLLAFGFCAAIHVLLAIQIQGLYHVQVTNTIRASAGSLISLADSAIVALAAPCIGVLADVCGINYAIAASALFYAVLLCLAPKAAQRAARQPTQEGA